MKYASAHALERDSTDALYGEHLWVGAGQTKRTKVVRLLAEGTVEAAILKMQERKLATKTAEEPETAILGQSEVDASTLVNIMNDHPPLPK